MAFKNANSCRYGSEHWTEPIRPIVEGDVFLLHVVFPMCCVPILVASIAVLLQLQYRACFYTLVTTLAYTLLLLQRLHYYLYAGYLLLGLIISFSIAIQIVAIANVPFHTTCIIMCGILGIVPQYCWKTRHSTPSLPTDLDIEMHASEELLITQPPTNTQVYRRKPLDTPPLEPSHTTPAFSLRDCF